ncbi:MAG: hypothetical protein LKI25_06140 [Atopobiaceae bacterium]|nr:hypothetical protein [Atopobiaceae bacterium]MCI2173777.1 hypothetical protein [Atopobiaceae bacterium]
MPPDTVDPASSVEAAGADSEELPVGERVGYFFLGLLLFLIGVVITIAVTGKRPEKARKQARLMALLGMIVQVVIFIVYNMWESSHAIFDAVMLGFACSLFAVGVGS